MLVSSFFERNRRGAAIFLAYPLFFADLDLADRDAHPLRLTDFGEGFDAEYFLKIAS